MEKTGVTGVILAGGTGSRLGGCDKSAIMWRGRSLAAHIADRLAPQVDRILINAPQPASHLPYEVPVIPDPWTDQRGPLAGVLAGLEASLTTWTVFVPCDNPAPPLQLRLRLEQAVATGTEAVYATHGADRHYLYALIQTATAPHLRNYLERGERSVFRWYQTLKMATASFEDLDEPFPNVNTPQDLVHLRARE